MSNSFVYLRISYGPGVQSKWRYVTREFGQGPTNPARCREYSILRTTYLTSLCQLLIVALKALEPWWSLILI